MAQKVYVGCSLGHASQELKQFVPEFKNRLTAAGFDVLEFLGEVAGTEADVYNQDIGHVRACDSFVAFVDEPSIGLGMELNEAICLEKPILCLKTGSTYVSRMLRGAGDLGLLQLEDFKTLDDAVAVSLDFLQNSRK